MPSATPKPPTGTAKQFASRGAGLFLARLLPTAAALFVMIYFSRKLPTAQYGVYQNFWVRYSLLTTLSCAGIPSFLFSLGQGRAVLFHRTLRRRLLVGFMSVWGTLGCLFAFWEASILPFWLPLLFLVLSTLSIIAESMLLAEGIITKVLLSNFIYSVLFIAFHTYWYRIGSSLQILFISIFLLGVAKTAFLVTVLYRRGVNQNADLMLTMPEKKLWAHIGLYDLLQQAARVADKFMVSFLVIPSASAIYFNGAQEVPFLPILLGAAGATLVQQASSPGDGAIESAGWARLTGKLLSSIVFPLACWLFLFREEIFTVVFSHVYEESAGIFAMTVIVLPLRAYPFTALLQHHKRGDLINTGALLDLLLAFALAPLLYQMLGLKGIALSFSLATLFLTVFYLWQTSKITGQPVSTLIPIKNWILKIFIFSSLMAISASVKLPGYDGSLRLILTAALALALCVLSLIFDLKRPQTIWLPPADPKT